MDNKIWRNITSSKIHGNISIQQCRQCNLWSHGIFCDYYIEIAKYSLNSNTKSVLCYILAGILKMLHPFMPYVTEEISSVTSKRCKNQ